MQRFGLSNHYLQLGVPLLLLGMLGIALPFVVALEPGTLALLHNATPYVLIAGMVLYVLGRIVVLRDRRREGG
jgi:hypothetical protein